MPTRSPEFALEHDEWGKLVLVRPDGSRVAGVDPVRAFPLSDPRRSISLLDPRGHEVGWVDRLDDLPHPARGVLEDELAHRHFLPVVLRVVGLTGWTEPIVCDAETDRGPVRFTIKAEEDVRRLPEGRVLITDANGVRYLIPDVAALDPASRRLMSRYA